MKQPFTPRFTLDLRCNFHILLIEFARQKSQGNFAHIVLEDVETSSSGVRGASRREAN
ncbi:MAG: hypothetical protein RMY64_29255 [Nostoc sp. DedQUE08]|uniref:hypothetical protein n=1 Tax=Nostoc sp. DedQUE08 TaxID=3075393 RepID=UPI002AD5A25A|nr:hypothetical protein [Nostoc sp. DedQUE08]MDZ8069649.1 hypothetical protein [Nostoc sp. DedQUE08]